jgi:aspartyl-tRNA(Asn)/glutamyl-tRNA(Gln) amidotransferase subunit C
MSKKFDINTLSRLARINLSDAEKEAISQDLENILAYVDKMNELDTAHIEPTSHVLNIENVFREDEARLTNAAEYVLDVLPEHRKDGRFFKVPKIIADSE